MYFTNASTLEERTPNDVSTVGDTVGEVAKALPGPTGAIVGSVAAALNAVVTRGLQVQMRQERRKKSRLNWEA
ncbi:hypothetical protein NHQ30_001522 [Ciborinia camelliae]|nr:hypothetical protein NHQ30_001522 [Ciborinia camelliae]